MMRAAITVTKGTHSPARFWALVERQAPLLSNAPLHFFRMAVNAASLERLFVQAGIIFAELRNRLAQK